MTWAGVDVGARRKGFHLAAVDERRIVAGPAHVLDVAEAVEWLITCEAALVAVDSPRECAPPGLRSRPAERALAAAVCGIRYTPDARSLAGNAYYDWIRNGLTLFAALDGAGLPAIECFPTASWTRWAGPRGTTTRARWSRAALAGAPLDGVPPKLNQDERDAIGAALTARFRDRGLTQSFGPIVVPL